ncbi:GAG-pre-integrase domain - like 5 [Theobroma cacao]|nr:GAG-pre-integrase domain - like 5 [Theobroma cacao]
MTWQVYYRAGLDSWLWHRRLGHPKMHTISKPLRKDLVVVLPKISFENDKVCDASQFGKQVRSSFKSKKVVSTSSSLELLHVDLFGPIIVASLGGKSHGFVIVDDYSRYTRVYFLAHKDDALSIFVKHCKRVQNE